MNQANMSQDQRESLSAGVDGELSKESLRFLLRRLEHDTSLRQTWSRYHVARDGWRQELTALASNGFAERVMAAIEQDVASVATPSRRSHWLRWSAGGVIAASVAAAALMVSQPTTNREPTTLATTSNIAAGDSALTARSEVPATVPQWLSGNSAGSLSQQAAATFGAPFGENQPVYAHGLSAHSPLRQYRTLDNRDGSYLLLLDPPSRTDAGARQAAVAQ
ncbi:MAG: sigma-E factor negative regulatory protein [Rhodanobacter sp.]